jgi:hypothetical protein
MMKNFLIKANIVLPVWEIMNSLRTGQMGRIKRNNPKAAYRIVKIVYNVIILKYQNM